jgi:hypothetical protein
LGPIAISGETVVALGGATNDQGGRQSVYVFTEPPGGWSGTIHEAAKLSASDGAYFGSVAIDGQTVVAAADDNAQGRENPAYVFTEPAGGWSRTLHESAKLADAGGAGILSVAISGQTVVASTVVYRALLGGIDVFTAPPGGWSGTLNETADLGGGSWGSAAISGDTVFATSKLSSGVSVFSEPSGGWSGTLQAGAQLTASDGASLYVAGSSDRTVIAGGATAAYVFTEPPSGWASESQAARLTNPSGQPYSVGISAQTVVESGNGSADYVFAQPSSGWSDEGPTATLAATGVPRTWAGAMRGFSVGKPKLTLKLTAGCFPSTYSVTISLPRGLAFNRNRRTLARALHLTPAGKFTFTTLTPAKLRVELNKPAALADLTINPPGLIESKALIARVKAHRRSPMPSIGLRISDAGGNNTRLTLRLPTR